jgi:hypothetical protein
MNHILLEIPAVVVILLFVCFVLLHAFTSPVPKNDDRLDIFMTRDTARNTSQSNPLDRSDVSRDRSGSGESAAQRGRGEISSRQESHGDR